MEEADRKPPKEFFQLVDAIARHPAPKRKNQSRKTEKSMRSSRCPPETPSED